MKRLLSTTTVLSLALAPIQPWPLMAQAFDLNVAEDGSVVAPDGTVLCVPTAEQACDLLSIMNGLTAEQPTDDAAAAEAAAAEAAAAEAAAAEATAAEVAAAEAAAAAAADAAAADEAAAAAAAAAEAAADEAAAAAAQAEADAAAAEAAAEADAVAAQAAAEADAAAAEAAAAEAANAAAAADAAAAQEAEAAASQAAAEADAAAAEAATAAEAEAVPPAGEAPQAPVAEAETAEPAAEPAAEAPVAEAPAAGDAPAVADVPQEPVDAPVVTAQEEESLLNLLAIPAANDDAASTRDLPGAAAAAFDFFSDTDTPGADASGTDTAAPADQPEPQTVTTTTVTEDTTRSSNEEFTAAPTAVEGDRRSGLSNLEKVGLLALGALVVGKVLSDGRRVVENTGDRVVVENPDGGYAVYKDDDTLLRRPGATVRTETFGDGSTRSTVDRADGTQVVTIRDASGRVLRRAAYDTQGREVVLIDDLVREERIDVSTLPVPRPERLTISTNDGDAALKAALAREQARDLGRSFSLRQIREIPQVRALAATIDVDNITFDSGSAVINPTEARKLASIGGIMDDILRDNPGEVFLIEGHTDAVGRAANNLSLSDRRAESVALALTEYFGIPPENMVVQGYGESELRVSTEADERRNRRAVVRVVTPLMTTASLR
jgi:outer membrane protein OmpA-like peptidoglycan-associated protein